jgi:hypothetical protein
MLFLHRVTLVEGEVQFEDVDDGLAEEAQLTVFRVLGHELPDGIVADAAFAGDASHLERC